MLEAKPYFMSDATFAESDTPYQVQTFTEKDKPPVCQVFETYNLAAGRICELVKAPMCPLTGAHLVWIKLLKRTKPISLIDAEINAADEVLKAGIGVKDGGKAKMNVRKKIT